MACEDYRQGRRCLVSALPVAIAVEMVPDARGDDSEIANAQESSSVPKEHA